MKVLNIMLSRDLGGIQQAFINYKKALELENITVINVTSYYAKINSYLVPDKTNHIIKVPNLGPWDILSSFYIKLLILFTKPDYIIVHGNRAIKFASRSFTTRIFNFITKRRPIVIGVAHNYGLKIIKGCDYIISITQHSKEFLIKQGFDNKRIQVIPNMIHVTKYFTFRNYQQPIVIATMARFVSKKGMDIFLAALAELKSSGYLFKAIIGGDGPQKQQLLEAAKRLQIDDQVSFIGWVENIDKFFLGVDIFCLPSLHEPFGIVILEAMHSSTPIVATRTEGPTEILRDEQDGLLCEVGSSQDLTKKLARLINNPDQAFKLAENSYYRLKANYDITMVAKKLHSFLKSIEIK